MMEETIKRLKGKGIVTTSQRIEILEYVKQNMNHPTADDVYRSMRERFPTISLATVYNILEKFVEVGEVRQLSIRRDKACFDGETTPHNHLFCDTCRRVINISSNGSALKQVGTNHRIDNVQSYYYGTCAQCLQKESLS